MDTNINSMYQKLGGQLVDKGMWFSRNAYKLSPEIFTRAEVFTFLNQQTGIPTSSISLADEKFFIENWEKWGNIIEFDLLNFQQYMSDYRDCDNYAFSFAARSSMIYGLNSCGVAFGNIYDSVTGKFLFRHAFNMILTRIDKTLRLYLYEPQTDQSCLWQAGKDNILEGLNWKYKPDWLVFF